MNGEWYVSTHTTGQIRDLEARVEILSGGKEEAIGEMRNMIKGEPVHVSQCCADPESSV